MQAFWRQVWARACKRTRRMGPDSPNTGNNAPPHRHWTRYNNAEIHLCCSGRTIGATRHRVHGLTKPMNRSRPRAPRDMKQADFPPRRRALFAIPALGALVLVLLWTVIFARLSVERDAATHASMASAAILSSALEQHTIKAIHQVDQITRFARYQCEKTPEQFNLASTVQKGVV